jgi:hypothetical protein
MRKSSIIGLAVIIVLLSAGPLAHPADAAFKVGAAKIDITPAQLPKIYEGILDRIYARAIVIDNGSTRASLVSVDVGMIGEQVWQTVSQN